MPSSNRCVFGCNTTGVTIHKFPNPLKYPELFRSWVKLASVSLGDTSDDTIYRNRNICDKHFTESVKNRNNRLNRLAVPTLHLPKTCTSIILEGSYSDTPSTSILQPQDMSVTSGTSQACMTPHEPASTSSLPNPLQAKEKVKSLRPVYVRNLKPLGGPTGSSIKKKYYLTDATQLAVTFVKTPGTPSGSLSDIDVNEPQEITSSTPTSSPPCITSPTHQTEHDLFNEYIKAKLSKKNDDNELDTNSANKMFLLSLLPDLNRMTPTQTRSFKRQVLSLIENVLDVPSSSTHI